MSEQSFIAHSHAHRQGGFSQRLVAALLAALEHGLYAERSAQTAGLLQRLDPRVKVIGALTLISATILVQRLSVILGLFLVAVALASLSRIRLRALAGGVWTSVLLFTGLLALPAIFIVPGEALGRLPGLGWTITSQGVASAALLVSRAETTATLAALLILTTPWTHVLKALRTLGAPAVLIVILGMTYRYLFLLLQTAHDMFEARQSRLVGPLSRREQRRIIFAGAGVLLSKSFYLAHEVFLAMQSRGYRGEHVSLDEFRLQPRDGAAALAIIALASFAVWLGG